MWLVYAVIHMFFMALVNYLDEYLTHSSTTEPSKSLHERIGGVLLISTLWVSIAMIVLIIAGQTSISPYGLYLSIGSSVPMVIVWAAYFYLMQIFSTHQVVPLFCLSSIWLLGIELLFGAIISPLALGGIAVLIAGSYLLDNGSLSWKVPSKLLLLMLPTSLCWAITTYITRIATQSDPALSVYFWQTAGIFVLGILAFLLVKPYRNGLIGRVKAEGKGFLLPSAFNEALSQVSFAFGVLSVAIAPLAVYFTASGGIQSIFLLLIFALFPLDKRNHVSGAQWAGVIFIAAGIIMLEFWR